MLEILVNKFSYKNNCPIIQNININLCKGKITSLIGASGSGKSTLLRILMGLEKEAQGKIIYKKNEIPLETLTVKQNIFTLVPQTPHLFPWKNILDNVALAISNKKVKNEQKSKQDIAIEALKIVQMESHINKYPNELSLGMMQRVSFARALVHDTEAILLDEPFSSLDAPTRYLLQEWLELKIFETNKYAILVTHDVREALSISNEIQILSGNPAEIKKIYTKNLLISNNFIEIEKEVINLIKNKTI